MFVGEQDLDIRPIQEELPSLPIRARNAISRLIESLQVGDQLPSETELASKLRVGRTTIREALRLLEEEGVIARRRGRGTFVAAHFPAIKGGLDELASITDMIRQTGKQPRTLLNMVTTEVPPKEVRSELNLEQDEEAISIVRVRAAGALPVAYCHSFVPVARLKHHRDVANDYDGDSLFKYLESLGITVASSISRIAAVPAEPQVAKELQLRLNEPILLLKQLHYDDTGKSVFYSVDHLHPQFFDFTILRRRKDQ